MSLVTSMIGFATLTLTPALLISVFLYKCKFKFMDFLRLIHLTLLIQSIFIIFSFISPHFKSLIDQYIPYSNISNLTEDSFRARGLTNESGATLSLLQSLNIFITLYLFNTSKSRIYSVFLMTSFGIILISLLPVGRTGLLSVIFIPFLFRNVLSSIRTIIISISSLIISFIVFKDAYYMFSYGGIENQFGNDIFETMMSWVTNEFVYDNGVSRTASYLLTNHIIFNDLSFTGILFGDPNVWSGILQPKGDIGYLRIFNSTGLIGLMLFYSIFLYLFRCLVKINPETAKLFFVLGLFILFTELKEPFLHKQSINGFLVLLFSSMILLNKTKQRVK